MQNDVDKNRDDITDRLEKIFAQINRLTEWYEQSVKLIITVPLIINAGALIALAAFFVSAECKANIADIRFSAISFLLGTIFGTLTLIFEFLTPCFAKKVCHDHFWLNLPKEGVLSELLKRYEQYDHEYEKRISKTIYLRIANGALAIVSSFIGMYFIGRYLMGDGCLVTMGLFCFIIYFVVMVFLLYRFLRL